MKRREEGSAHTARLRFTQRDKKGSLPLLHSDIFSYHFVIKRNSFFFFQLKSSEDAPSAVFKTAAVRRDRTGRVMLHSAGSAEDWHGGGVNPGRLAAGGAERRWAASGDEPLLSFQGGALRWRWTQLHRHFCSKIDGGQT